MKTADLMFNRSAILLALLTSHQGREIELLHEFAELFNMLSDFSNDVVFASVSKSPSHLNRVKRNLAIVLQHEVEGLRKSPLAELSLNALTARRAEVMAAHDNGTVPVKRDNAYSKAVKAYQRFVW